jgi:hypothetical protein
VARQTKVPVSSAGLLVKRGEAEHTEGVAKDPRRAEPEVLADDGADAASRVLGEVAKVEVCSNRASVNTADSAALRRYEEGRTILRYAPALEGDAREGEVDLRRRSAGLFPDE